jgi:hypothetical protein
MNDGVPGDELLQVAAEAVNQAFGRAPERPLEFAAELLLETLSRHPGWQELVAALSAEEFSAMERLASPDVARRLRQARSE